MAVRPTFVYDEVEASLHATMRLLGWAAGWGSSGVISWRLRRSTLEVSTSLAGTTLVFVFLQNSMQGYRRIIPSPRVLRHAATTVSPFASLLVGGGNRRDKHKRRSTAEGSGLKPQSTQK